MFEKNIKLLYDLFDEEAKPDLSKDELEVVPERYFTCFK